MGWRQLRYERITDRLTKKSSMKKIIEYLPLIGAFLVFNGFLKLYLFYGHWDIKIIDYLDLSEILLSFLNDINIILVCLIVFLFHQIMGYLIVQVADKKLQGKILIADSNDPTTHSKEPISDIIETIYTHFPWIFFILSIVATVFFGWKFFNNFTIFWLYAGIVSLFQLLIKFLEKTITEEYFSNEIAILLTFLAFTYCLAWLEIKKVEQNLGLSVTTIYTENETITTNKTNFLLGKTQKFIYVYDNKTNCTRILPTDKIKSIETQRQNK
jgi:hypothetical protein